MRFGRGLVRNRVQVPRDPSRDSWHCPQVTTIEATELLEKFRAGDLTRFSQVLTAEQRAATGLDQLTSDQLAVLDALVRHDDAYAVPSTPAHPRPARFSQRLNADERRNAGFTRLSVDQLTRLDALVEQRVPLRVPFVAPAAGVSASAVEIERVRPQIHGEVTLGMGWASGGYSEMGGSMVVDYYDPAHNFDLLMGYSEVHTKGPAYYRNCPDGFLTRR